MRVVAKLGFVWCCLMAAGVACGQATLADAPVLISGMVRTTEFNGTENAQAVMARSDLAAADRQKIADILQRLHETADKLAAEAGDKTIDMTISPMELGKLMDHYSSGVMAEYNRFMTPRSDLDWMKARAQGIKSVEEPMLAVQTADYANVVSDAGIAKAKAEEIAVILEKCRTDLKQQEKLMQVAFVTADAAGKSKVLAEFQLLQARTKFAARTAVRAKLTAAEVAALDWQFLKEYKGMPTFATLGYSAQGQTWPAPEDGVYVLEESPGRRVLGTVTLKQGAMMGFRGDNATMKAVAGEKTLDVPAGALVYWMRAEE